MLGGCNFKIADRHGTTLPSYPLNEGVKTPMIYRCIYICVYIDADMDFGK